MKYNRILAAIASTPWMIYPPKLEEIIGVIEARAAGVTLGVDEWKEIESRRMRHAGVSGGVAVMPLLGTISQRVGLLTGSGGVSTDEFGRQFDEAMNNPDVGAILLDVDSPGGSVFGVDELATKIRSARGQKRTVALVNSQAYSAGYYLASAAEEVVITPSGMLGSIGTRMVHVDESKLNEQMGIDVTYIYAGKYKVEGNPDEPLGDEARAEIQRMVDRYYQAFVAAVAANRGVSASHVEEHYGQGRVFGAEDAVARGMADRIGTYETVMSDLFRPSNGSRRLRAERRLKIHKAS